MLFIMPTLILLIVINIFPLLYSLYLSFTEYSVIANEPPQWIALENYRKNSDHDAAVTGTTSP